MEIESKSSVNPVTVDDLVVLVDFKVTLLLSSYPETNLLYPWCSPHRYHEHDPKSKSSMYGSLHLQLSELRKIIVIYDRKVM